MNWTEHLKYGRLYQEFINWYKNQVDVTTFYALSDTEATNIDNYLRCFHNVTTNEQLFKVAVKTYIGKPFEITKSSEKLKYRPTSNKPVTIDGTEGWVCVYCEERAWTVDHLVPLGKGGTNETENLVHACAPCNEMKSDMFLVDFISHIDRLIVQFNHMKDTVAVGRLGLMLFNATKLLEYADLHYDKIFSPIKKTSRSRNYKAIQKKSLGNRINKAHIEPVAPLVSKKKKATSATKKEPKEKLFISEHVPYHKPKPKIDEAHPTYLDISIAKSREAGFKTLWEYELSNPETWRHRVAI